MIESFLTHADVVKGEPALDDYLREDQTSFDEIIEEARTDMMKDLIDMNFQIRKLCKRLSLQTSVTKTAAFDSDLSDEDFAQRLRLVIDVTDKTGTAVFDIQGTDDDGTTYYDILTSITISETGKQSFLLTQLYKKYRLKLISIGTTITYSSYLVETSLEKLHLYKTRAKIYESLRALAGDHYQGKAESYMQMYEKMLSDTRLYYDDDDDGEISEDNAEDDSRQVVFRP